MLTKMLITENRFLIYHMGSFQVIGMRIPFSKQEGYFRNDFYLYLTNNYIFVLGLPLNIHNIPLYSLLCLTLVNESAISPKV